MDTTLLWVAGLAVALVVVLGVAWRLRRQPPPARTSAPAAEVPRAAPARTIAPATPDAAAQAAQHHAATEALRQARRQAAAEAERVQGAQQQQQRAREQARQQALQESRVQAEQQAEHNARQRALAEQQARQRALAEQQARQQALVEQQARQRAVAEQQARQQAELAHQSRQQALAEQQARQRTLAEPSHRAQAPLPPAAPPPAAPLVLVVDDSKVVRIKTGRLLEKLGLRVQVADDGLAALQCLQAETPDLVITDVEMPGLDGFELTRRLRTQPQWARVPVMMITSSDDRHRAEATAAGVSVLLGKPYAEDDLLTQVQQLLARNGQRAGSPLALH